MRLECFYHNMIMWVRDRRVTRSTTTTDVSCVNRRQNEKKRRKKNHARIAYNIRTRIDHGRRRRLISADTIYSVYLRRRINYNIKRKYNTPVCTTSVEENVTAPNETDDVHKFIREWTDVTEVRRRVSDVVVSSGYAPEIRQCLHAIYDAFVNCIWLILLHSSLYWGMISYGSEINNIRSVTQK